jgi:hypothetical protein
MSIKYFSILVACACSSAAQSAETAKPNSPIYSVTVVKSTIQAINYTNLNRATKIDFRGTVLLPHAHGEATVTSMYQAAQVEAKLNGLDTPSRFGPQFLTYVMWAVTPQGRTMNLGEVLSNSANKGRVSASVPLQVFGLMITAEPYFAVPQPSNVVVMENMVRPDTAGKVEPVSAKYEFMPRGEPVTLNVSSPPAQPNGEKLSMERYNALLATYQAVNAVQLARAAGATEYAPDTLSKAEESLKQAQDAYARKAPAKDVVAPAREAAQTAEDARSLTEKRKQEDAGVARKGLRRRAVVEP